MIRVDDARALMLAALPILGEEIVDYDAALGRVLSQPMIARRTQPPFAASAMDGYAVRSADMGATPVRLRLVGESAAGHGSDTALIAGCAMRISTGAPVPEGADQVVIQENVTRDGDTLVLDDTARPMANIRRPGVDFSEGQELLTAGIRVTPDAVALAVGAGLTELAVVRRPRIGILSTGDELVEPGESTGPDQIINSVSRGIDGLVRAEGGEPVYLGIARDSEGDVRRCLRAGAGLDLVVTIGGASVGDHDHLRAVFAADGGSLAFEKIAMKPGKPTWFGKLHGTHFLGLPGNPVSALVAARLFLRPALWSLTGRAEQLVHEQVEIGSDLPANGSRETYVRAARDPATGRVSPIDNQDSSALAALVRSDFLIRREIEAPAARAGDRLPALRV